MGIEFDMFDVLFIVCFYLFKGFVVLMTSIATSYYSRHSLNNEFRDIKLF